MAVLRDFVNWQIVTGDPIQAGDVNCHAGIAVTCRALAERRPGLEPARSRHCGAWRPGGARADRRRDAHGPVEPGWAQSDGSDPCHFAFSSG